MNDRLYAQVDLPDGKVFKILYDAYPSDPREWSNLGKMVCWHRRYILGDPHDFATPDDFHQFWDLFGAGGVCLDLYMYDHGGVTISTVPFSCSWDSGQIGYIYALASDIKKEFASIHPEASDIVPVLRGEPTREMIRRATAILEEEVRIYDMYLRGDVYGYVIEKDGEVVDSCWGFYGCDFLENGILSELTPQERQIVEKELGLKPRRMVSVR